MEIKELQEFAEFEIKRRNNLFKKDNHEMTLVDSIKLSEEVGELMNEILNYLKLQRKEKLDPTEVVEKHLGEELSDVLIVVSILSQRLGINIENALKNKIDIIKERKY